MKSKIRKSTGQIAQFLGIKLLGDTEKIITGVAPFEDSSPHDITLAGEAHFLKNLEKTSAGAIIVPESFKGSEDLVVQGCAVFPVKHPRAAWAMVMQLFYPPSHPQWGMSNSANLGENVAYGKDPNIGPFTVICNNVGIGDRVVIYPHVYIGEGAVLGDDVTIYANVTIGDGTKIGSRVIIQPGAVIGSDGFGFAPDGNKWKKIPQLGIVQIGDDVEIGASNTIDRATFGKTRIGSGVKTDNQVHIAHNVTVGENSVLVAQVGISGSVTIGKNAILAGQAGVAEHLTIGDGAIIGPASGVAKDVPDKAVYSGAPAQPHRHWLRVQNVVATLPELKKRILKLESLVAEIKSLGNSKKD
jgi:UDP-3-O-[3-hydroxymyristoyl] glucosamine N-acyltransferase